MCYKRPQNKSHKAQKGQKPNYFQFRKIKKEDKIRSLHRIINESNLILSEKQKQIIDKKN